ncbi:MAG: thiamine phosphate synthase [bacterium]|nr:thiamine phosphate synthase [bacterium]
MQREAPLLHDAPAMILVAITPEQIVTDEAAKVTMLLDGGFATVHLRHPEADEAEMRRLIESIPARLHPRLRLHDHHRLANEYATGVHFNGRNPIIAGCRHSASASCHTIAEVQTAPEWLDYVTLSPVYSSISKRGYLGVFTPGTDLRHTIAGRRVVALGGVTPSHLPELADSGFYGAAMLGAIPWTEPLGHMNHFLTTISQCYNS